jgi:iron complex outermembrane receptor protein
VEKEGWPSVQLGGEVSNSDGHRSGTDFETALVHLTIAQTVGGGRISGDFGLARRDFGAEDFYAPYPSFEKTRSYTSSLRWVSDFERRMGLEIGASFRRHEDEFTLIRDDPGFYQNRHTSSQVGGDLLFRGDLGVGAVFALGGEVYRDALASNSLGDRGENRGAAFGEVVLGGSGSGVATIGLRQDWHQGFDAFFSPSISASIPLGPLVRARAAVGRSFRAPTWTERYYRDPVNVGTADLEPERAWSGEVGLDVVRSARVRLGITAFLRRAADLIDWARPAEAGPDVPWETRNVESATFRGLEGDLTVRGPWETRWTLGVMVLSVESEQAMGFSSKYALRPLEEQVTLGAGKTFGGALRLDLNLQRAKRKGEDPYHRLDVRGGIDVGPARIYVDATNLTAEEYPDVTGALAPGRAFFVGLEIGASGGERE